MSEGHDYESENKLTMIILRRELNDQNCSLYLSDQLWELASMYPCNRLITMKHLYLIEYLLVLNHHFNFHLYDGQVCSICEGGFEFVFVIIFVTYLL